MKRLTFASLALLAILGALAAGCSKKEEPIDPGPVAKPGEGVNAPDGMENVGGSGGAESASNTPDLATTP